MKVEALVVMAKWDALPRLRDRVAFAIEMTEREARDIKPHLAVVKAEIAEAVVGKPQAERPAIVKRIVRKHRAGGLDLESTGIEIAGSPIYRVVPPDGKTGAEAKADELTNRANMGAAHLGSILALLVKYLRWLPDDEMSRLLSEMHRLHDSIAAIELAIIEQRGNGRSQ